MNTRSTPVSPVVAFRIVVALACPAQLTMGQPAEWACSAGGPPGRGAQSMAFDARHHKTVMFGGTNNNDPNFNDTWLLEGMTWHQAGQGGPTPPARSNAGMAYDYAAGRIIMFGGAVSPTIAFGDTWAWDGAEWSQLHDLSGPGLRGSPALASDPDRARVVMFGGGADTWEWDGSDWLLVANSGPSPRTSHAMAYLGGGKVLLFGGADSQTTTLGDTWIWDGVSATWAQVSLTPSQSPPARAGHVMVYQSHSGKVLLFGGGDATHLHDTWEFDGCRWNQVYTNVTPAARTNFAGAFDTILRRAVFFGGNRGGSYNTSEACWFVPAATCQPCCCPADYNHDGFVDGIDYDQFNNDFETGC